jgi:uncharacterized membrane protein YeaQ/YmgE (transglycosylase-associated protein family)
MLLLTILVLGLSAGWVAHLLTGGSKRPGDWIELLVAGLVGSFVGGLLISLAMGGGLAIRPSGIIGSVTGAVIVLTVWRWVRASRQRR